MNLQNIKNHTLVKKHNCNVPDSIINNVPDMLALLVKLTAKPGKADELKEVLAITCGLVRANEPDVVEYHVMQSMEDPHIFKMFEVYRDEEALERHTSGTPYISELLPQLTAPLAEEPQVEMLHSTLF